MQNLILVYANNVQHYAKRQMQKKNNFDKNPLTKSDEFYILVVNHF